jgi:hypothetical protein
MPLTKRVRFQVFESANFTCAYCGQKPPAVVLEVDHIVPVSKGGTDAKSNLVCSCFDCNRGKGAKKLGEGAPDAVAKNAEQAKERLAQLRAIGRYEQKIQAELETLVDRLGEYWFCGLWNMNTQTLSACDRSSIKRFLSAGLSEADMRMAMEIACNKRRDLYNGWRYLCGICWNWIKDGGRVAHDRKVSGNG